MKKLLIVLLFFGHFVCSQNKLEYEYSISLSTNLQVAMGDNYLNKSYSNARGFGLSFQNNLRKNIFMGVFFNYYAIDIVQPEKIGSFDSSDSYYFGVFMGYYHEIAIDKLYLEYALGYGFKSIQNKSNFGNYQISGQPISIGIKTNYKLKKQVDIFIKNDFILFNNNVNIIGEYRDFYKKGIIYEPSIGIRYNFSPKKQ